MEIDSKVTFQARLVELELGELSQKLTDLNWDTYAKLAFAVPSTAPGVVDEDVFKRQVLEKLFSISEGQEMPAQATVVRRLWYESHVLFVGSMRQKLERSEDDAPKRMPHAEREERKDRLRTKLAPGLVMEKALEPADYLIDKFFNMADLNRAEWVPWEHCPPRSKELGAGPAKKKWLPDGSSVVRERTVRKEPTASITTAMDMCLALQRRGLVAEIAGVLSYERHELLRNRLMCAISDKEVDARYEQVSIEQACRADRRAWELLSRACSTGIKPVGGALPLDTAMVKVLKSYEFTSTLLPLPAKERRGKKRKAELSSGSSTVTEEKKKKRKRNRKSKKEKKDKTSDALQAEVGDLRRQLRGKSAGRNVGKGKDAGKDQGSPPVPQALLPGKSITEDGDRICFGYNLGTCRDAKPGERCKRGFHVCSKAELQGGACRL